MTTLTGIYHKTSFISDGVYALSGRLTPILETRVHEVQGATSSWARPSSRVGGWAARSTTVAALALLPALSLTPLAVAPISLLLFGSGAPVAEPASSFSLLRGFDRVHQYGALGLVERGCFHTARRCESAGFTSAYRLCMLGAIVLGVAAQTVRIPVSLAAGVANIVGAAFKMVGSVVSASVMYLYQRVL